MNYRIKILMVLLALMHIVFAASSQKTYSYESVENDPTQTRIYTLDNGLKVYISVNTEEPKIQSFVVVRVGGKHDPSETTGLAHYFEHMMFKGTPNFGSSNWEKEKILIDEIERLFEVYRVETNNEKRKALYKIIDSVSYEASKYAIPNEYDKMLKMIGSTGTNAATSYDFTFYIENIPSNQFENWLKIQYDRFKYPVLRLFHTELETVYEEKNMSLTNDGRKAREAMFQGLYPNHPYGTQTVLGEPDHLKNPSMKNIREFFDKYYVPNNMSIILAGDLDPDVCISLIDQYFGKMEAKKLPDFVFAPEKPINEPIVKTVKGLEAENLLLAWRFPGAAAEEIALLNMLGMMLFNGKAGLIDLNLNQQQMVQRATASAQSMADYSALVMSVRPKAGQTLDEARFLLLEQIRMLKAGNFPDWMLEAAINNLRLSEMRRFESNSGRAYSMLNAFINGISWERQLNYIDRLAKITKDDLIRFANEHLGNNYVAVYKLQDKPEDIPTVEKPPITPIELNRDMESDFIKSIAASTVKEIEPVFVDYNKEIKMLKTKAGLEIMYVPNTTNNTFSFYYHYDIGRYHDNLLSMAVSYLPYLGTSRMSAAEIQQEFYKIACSFDISAGEEETYVSVSGISDNFEQALILVEELLSDPQPNEEALKNLIRDILKSRQDAKANQRSNFSALVQYASYGENSPMKYRLSESELQDIEADDLIGQIKKLSSYKHKVLFYGSISSDDLSKTVNKIHKTPKKWAKTPQAVSFEPLETKESKVYFAHYDANQSYLQMLKRSVKYDVNMAPKVGMYNAYFGGGMNAIVFQEMREKRSLAYTATSSYQTPSQKDRYYMNNAFIATQNDKVIDAFDAFNELFNDMPLSERAFELARNSLISNIRTQRITQMSLIWNYLSLRKYGLTDDRRKILYEKLPAMKLTDVLDFNNTYVKNKPHVYVILGREEDIDFKGLEKYGQIRKLTQEDIFGY